MVKEEKSFLRELFHEIENAANAIKGLGQLLEQENGKEEREELTKVIIDEAKSIMENIECYATLTFPSSLRITLVKTDEILKKVGLLSKKEMDEGNIVLNYRLEKKSPLIEGDKERLKVAFRNLILNAIQSMPQGGTLTLSTRNIIFSSAPFFEIAFSDTGIGITEKNLSRIFDPFFTTKEGRAGLGLSIVKNIVEAHHGKIYVERKKQGTTFKITLPLRQKRLK